VQHCLQGAVIHDGGGSGGLAVPAAVATPPAAAGNAWANSSMLPPFVTGAMQSFCAGAVSTDAAQLSYTIAAGVASACACGHCRQGWMRPGCFVLRYWRTPCYEWQHALLVAAAWRACPEQPVPAGCCLSSSAVSGWGGQMQQA
jgi:hypothetical protein